MPTVKDQFEPRIERKTKLYSMTLHLLSKQNQFNLYIQNIKLRSASPTLISHQTWLLSSTICFHGWETHWKIRWTKCFLLSPLSISVWFSQKPLISYRYTWCIIRCNKKKSSIMPYKLNRLIISIMKVNYLWALFIACLFTVK